MVAVKLSHDISSFFGLVAAFISGPPLKMVKQPTIARGSGTNPLPTHAKYPDVRVRAGSDAQGAVFI
jgi:hypothetical protein